MEVETLTNSLQSVFNDIQHCDSKTYSHHLTEIILKIKESNISEDFTPIVYSTVMCRRPQMPSKLILFYKRIFEEVQESESGRNFIMDIYHEVISLVDSKIVRVRRNALILLKLLTSTNGLTEIVENSLLEKIAEKLFDKEKSVRKEALLFLTGFQDKLVHGNTPVMNLFKNLCRFDPSNEVRKVAFQNLKVTSQTYKCIIERCIDVNLSIRTVFFKKYLNKISVRELDYDMKIFLLKRTYSERDFSAVEYLIEVVSEQYDLPTEFINVIEDFYCEKYEKIFKKFINRLFDLNEFKYSFSDVQNNQTVSSFLLFYYYLTYIEENKGKDDLELPNLSEFAEFLYSKAKEAEDGSNIDVVRMLYKIARMYDVFDDVSRKIISNTVYKLLKKGVNEDVVMETVGLLYSIDSDLGDKLFGSLIYKNLESNIDLAMLIAKNLMKNSTKIDAIQSAIISEIVMQNIQHTSSPFIVFYYLALEFNQELLDVLIETRETNLQYLPMLIDLSIVYKSDELINLAISEIKLGLESENEDVIIPTSKLVLSELLKDKSIINKYISHTLRAYYSSASDKTQQYLDIFFHKYFTSEPESLISVFFFVYESLEANLRIFVDQTLYWVESSHQREALQLLYYNICLNMYIYYENIKNIKSYINILNKIQMDERWTPIVTKKILFCCTQLLKKEGNKKYMSEVINKIMMLDDGEPIEPEHLLEVKTDLLLG
ncbi:Condensin complex subunit 3 [Nosema granulosis]|uniref:Condensin complex subunit 3 n=1 Tax=Nosema granulosis TaxID=83296 RepID=A0A9P6H106_9MICR|nr:Condensin complex subunit 3 [Nosema granulosis]